MNIILAILVGAVVITAALTICYLVGKFFYFIVNEDSDDMFLTAMMGFVLMVFTAGVLFACYVAGNGIIDSLK